MPRAKKNIDPAEQEAKKKAEYKKRSEADKKRKQEADTTAARNANLKYKTAEELRAACDAYFADCDAKGALYGEAGLALWLDVSLSTLWSWFDGRYSTHLQAETQRAYLKIQNQIETSPTYQDKALAARAIFLMKQMRLGGKVDKVEARQDIAVKVKMGSDMDESDFA